MREAALADAERRLGVTVATDLNVPIRLSTIDDAALRAWRSDWTSSPSEPGGWDWRAERLAWRSTLNRFEVAIWSGSVLCGLGIGKPSRGPSHLAIYLIEGNPDRNHPLKGAIADCVTDAAIRYGQLLGKAQLRFLRPLPGALPTYLRLGFMVAQKGAQPPYCFMEI